MKSFNVRDHNGNKVVDSISLYMALGMHPVHYCKWARRLKNLGDENIDFFKQKSMIFDLQKTKMRLRYHITIQFACELCAASRTERGRQLKYEFRRLLGINVKI